MGLYSLELWLFHLKKQRELDVSPSLDCWGLCLNWFGLGLFCFLLFLIVQTELICSQLWKIQGMMKTSASQDFHQATCVAWQHPLCVGGARGRMGKLEKPADASGWENVFFPTETRLHCTVVWGGPDLSHLMKL